MMLRSPADSSTAPDVAPPSSDAAARYENALAFLLARINYERTPASPAGPNALRLDRMRELLARLGDPQQGQPIVHVAGTKGKGSTSTMIAAALAAAGYCTGTFSSPHLHRIEERIALDSRPCTTAEFVDLFEQVRRAVEAMDAALTDGELGPTYFEITTAMALLHFAQSRVDAAVLEVGLGGRLDSTNVCQPALAVITSISFDHMRQLGNTLGAIAGEKAGIIKPGVPTVSGVRQAEPRAVIEQRAREVGSRLIEAGVDFGATYRAPRWEVEGAPRPTVDIFSLNEPGEGEVSPTLTGVELGMIGQHQADNAAVAIASLLELRRQGWRLPDAAIRQGLRDARCAARIEVVSWRPTIVIDAAHNLASIEALVRTLDESFPHRPRRLLFATSQDKDAAGMLALLAPRFDQIVLTRYLSNPRSIAPEELFDLVPREDRGRVTTAEDPAAGWNLIVERLGPEELACIAGSFFLAAEMRARLVGGGA